MSLMNFIKKSVSNGNTPAFPVSQEVYNQFQEFKAGNLDTHEQLNDFFRVCKTVEEVQSIDLSIEQVYAAHKMIFEQKSIDMPMGEGKSFVGVIVCAFYAMDGRNVKFITSSDILVEQILPDFDGVLSALGVALIRSSFEYEQMLVQGNAQSHVIVQSASDMGRDLLFTSLSKKVSTRLSFVKDVLVIDEADQILLDQGMLPYKFEAPDVKGASLIPQICDAIDDIKDEYFEFSDKKRTDVYFTDDGFDFLENKLSSILGDGSLYSPSNVSILTLCLSVLRAEKLYQEGVEYVVTTDTVVPVDPISGALMNGAKFPAGIQQFLEYKFNLPITSLTKTVSETSIMNIIAEFRDVVCMSGSLSSVNKVLYNLYGIHVALVPRTHDTKVVYQQDELYKTKNVKHLAMAQDISTYSSEGYPCLTVFETRKELLEFSKVLQVQGVYYISSNDTTLTQNEFLKAAGEKGTVSLLTREYGRGVHIEVSPEVKDKGIFLAVGGRSILERLDRQISGRVGRRGLPGTVKFYMSFEDDIFIKMGQVAAGSYFDKRGLDHHSAIIDDKILEEVLTIQNIVEEERYEALKAMKDQYQHLHKMYIVPQSIFTMASEGLSVEHIYSLILAGLENDLESIFKSDEAKIALNDPLILSLLESLNLGAIDNDQLVSKEDLVNLLYSHLGNLFQRHKDDKGYLGHIIQCLTLVSAVYTLKAYEIYKSHQEGIHLRVKAGLDPKTELMIAMEDEFQKFKSAAAKDSIAILFKSTLAYKES